ncbi:MAG: hypothetical protein ACI9BD_000810 [Candidatus Marinamargulisbacteria bacterium]|jgi:hypothetical protein
MRHLNQPFWIPVLACFFGLLFFCSPVSASSLSDLRIQDEVTPIDSAMDKLFAIRGVYFKWNTESYKPPSHEVDQRMVGVVAQEVEKVFPELVSKSLTGYMQVDYEKLVAVTIQAVNEMHNELHSQGNGLRELHERLIKVEAALAEKSKAKKFNWFGLRD